MLSQFDFTEFFHTYVYTALKNHPNHKPALTTHEMMRLDCGLFWQRNANLLTEALHQPDYYSQLAGEDFWWTHNYDTAHGFWARPTLRVIGPPSDRRHLSESLSEAARKFPPTYFYINPKTQELHIK